MSLRSCGLLASLVGSLLLPLGAVTVINTTAGTSLGTVGTGGRGGVQANGVVEVSSWTQTRGYTNVTIAAALATTDLGYNTVTAYLTTKAGTGATAADVVATAVVNIPAAGVGLPPLTTLFTALTLNPGTYYLIIAGDPGQTTFAQSWYYYDSSTTTLDTGVTLAPDQYADGLVHPGSVTAFIPASTFYAGSWHNVYTVSGDAIQPPQITKSYGTSALPLGTTTTLSLAITNPNVTAALTNVSFTDNLPAGLPVASPTGLIVTCPSGTFTAASNSTTLTLTGATLAAGGTCTFTLNVYALTAGFKANSVQATSPTSGPGNTASASLMVVGPPNLGQTFGTAAISLNGVTSLTYTIVNPNLQAVLSGVGFTNILPTGLEIASPANLLNGCGGTALASAGGSSVSVSSIAMNSSAQCTISVNVKGTTVGPKANSVQITSGNAGAGGTSLATLSVAGPPALTKSFSKQFISVGGTAVLTFAVTNPNTVPLTGVAFSDSLPSGLVIGTPNNLTATGCGSSFAITAVPATTLITVSNATVGAGTPCLVSLDIKGVTQGVKTFSSSAVTADNAPTGAGSGPSITVLLSPTLSKVFGAVALPVGGSTTLSFTISNPGTVVLNNVSFTDSLPAGLVVSTPNGLTGGCGPFVTATAGSGTISYAGANFLSQASCTFSVNVTGLTAGLLVNTTSAITASNSDPGAAATASINFGSQFQVRYAGNLTIADSVINLTNTGANSVGSGTLCANVYVFAPDEQLISCCSCPITPNGLASISAQQDLISNTLTPAAPSSVVIKILSSQPGAGVCSAATPTVATLAPGLAAWGTTTHLLPNALVTETPFTESTLSATELARITTFCGFIQSNGSGFGLCRSCRSGSLGGSTKK